MQNVTEALGSPSADREDVERGLVLLALQSQAADVRAAGWIKRRVEQLEFLDTRAVRWRVSIDFEVPIDAPVVRVVRNEFRLIPITTMPKGDLVSFDLRDEHDAALWLPTSAENNRRLAPALVVIARRALKRDSLPGGLEQDLMRIVATLPSEHERAYRPFSAAAALIDVNRLRGELHAASQHLSEYPFWRVCKRFQTSRNWERAQDALTKALEKQRIANQTLGEIDGEIREAAFQLMDNPRFRSQLEELAQNYVVNVGVAIDSLTRRIVKLASERSVTFWSRRGIWHKVLQGLGWRCWPVDVLIGGRGGSHHLEVAAPPGVDVVRVTARPTDPRERKAPVLRTAGFSPHVHISIPAATPLRYRATIDVRISRSGWLFASLLVGGLIAVVMMFGRHDLAVLFPASSGAVSGEAGTAATLLLALLGVIALWLVRPGEHPLAARLLVIVRGLILIGVADLLVGTGNLVLHQTTHPLPTTLWSVLAWASVVIAVMIFLSWLMPRELPWRSGNKGHRGYASGEEGAKT